MADRQPRDLQTREREVRPASWAPAPILPEPTPIPGYTYRWVRVSTLGQPDPTNVSARFREGYVPCKAADHPELMVMSDPASRFPDNVEIGGLLLCKTPTENFEARQAYYMTQAREQEKAVDQSYMKLNDNRMPLFADRVTTVSRGSFK